MKHLTDLSVSTCVCILPVSLLQQNAIFGPADFGGWESFCRAQYGQWLCGVGDDGTISNVDVDVLLKSQRYGLLLSNDHWFVHNSLRWKALRPVK